MRSHENSPAVAKVLFHGSPHRTGNKAFGVPGNRKPIVSAGRPFYLTEDLPYATYFARGGTVSAVSLQADKVVDLHQDEVLKRLLGVYNADPEILAVDGPWDVEVEGEIGESAYRILDSPAVMTLLRSEGYQAALLPEDNDLKVKAYAVLDPDCVEFSHLMNERKPRDTEPGPGL